jgi:hypothetical protein
VGCFGVPDRKLDHCQAYLPIDPVETAIPFARSIHWSDESSAPG